eukprot:m.120232 g.120232  ORF g.120232 m.120232 type:complete len:211 (-) comp14548_c4_seq3:30-662(-)
MERVGDHCNVKDCRMLDFLPFKCNACRRIYCQEHRHYDAHACAEAYAKDFKSPPCPLCGVIVPIPAGSDANTEMMHHMDRGCAPPRGSAVPSFSACGVPGCKKKEVVPMTCAKCRRNFCVRHRFEGDHQCAALAPPASSKPAAPATARANPSPAARAAAARAAAPQQRPVQPTQMSEDEALALALQRSLEDTSGDQGRSTSNEQANCRVS